MRSAPETMTTPSGRNPPRDLSGEDLFFELAIEDLRRAADLFLPIHEITDGVDGWVSLEVSPLLAYDTSKTVEMAKALHERAGRSNLFIKIPGTKEGLPAIEECVASGVPVNVTLLFSADQYQAAADAYLRGVERRVEAGLNPAVGSVASVFMSRWDVAVAGKVPADLKNMLGLAVGLSVYRAYRRADELRSLAATRQPGGSDTAAPVGEHQDEGSRPRPTRSTCTAWPPRSRSTRCLTRHSRPSTTTARSAIRCPPTVDESDELLSKFAAAGIDVKALADQLQAEGAKSFVEAWNDLIQRIEAQSSSLK